MYRVVLADDSEEFLAWLRSALENTGDFLPVGQAANGVDAIQLIARLVPDVAIIDVDMPELDGLDVAEWVRRQALPTKVVVVTAHTDRAYASLADQAGAFAFIPKAALSVDTLRDALKPAEAS